MKRIHPVTGELFLPYRYQDGKFRVADPRHGAVKHHAELQIAVETEEELDAYARRRFHVRMQGVRGKKVSLISPQEIIFKAA
ncbi:hypothetical protein ASD99_08490 [Mesorhizobium sp. Root695]|uniref:hypothetical protein n=1 Tax=Mesorhizobium sp. Root695 TaxID=1736589 RepID=UPI00070F7428|nr:hypothetical protein [Mesorhizobium sp. Root695]KRB16395.1 hypothetical protein ASD99_08490 [Mesorhizobium sp. Root695]